MRSSQTTVMTTGGGVKWLGPLLSLLLSVALLPPASATAAAQDGAFGNAGYDITVDPGGVNSPQQGGPNSQRDLTLIGIGQTPAPGTIDVLFNFDNTQLSGSNTADGCLLFDADGDDLVDNAVCATVSQSTRGGPFDTTTTTVYGCDEQKVDRCMRKTVIASGSTACTDPVVTATDPFTGGSDEPFDAQVRCTVDLSALTATPELTLVCAYPSQQPNSNPRDCIAVPAPPGPGPDPLTVEAGKSASPTSATAGDVVTFTASVTNTSTDPVELISLRDAVEGAVGDVDLLTAPLGGTCQGKAGTMIAPGDTFTCTFLLTLSTPGSHIDEVTATVEAADGRQASDTSDEVIVPVTPGPMPGSPDVTVTKSVTPLTSTGGDFTFTATVRNNSTTDAVTLSALRDLVTQPPMAEVDLFTATGLDSGLADACVDVTPPVVIPANAGGADNTFQCTFTVEITGAGTVHTDRLLATVDDDPAAAPDPVVVQSNPVTVEIGGTPPSPPPPPPAPQPADLSVVKTVDEDRVEPGDLAIYTLTVTNDGPGSTTATVTDDVPDGFAVVSATPSRGTCSIEDQLVSCALGVMADGAVATVTVTARAVDPGEWDNIAVVDGSVPDGNPDNDEDTVTVEVPDTGLAQICEPFDSGIVRLEGPTRIETAIDGAQALFCDGEADAVVLTRSDLFPDAQAGTPLAISLDAPLLLSEPASLNPATEAEILRVLRPGGTVYLLGGTAALSDAVEARVRDLGYDTVRYGGANRYGTAAIIADEGLGNPSTLMVTNGDNFPDSVVAGAAALQAGEGTIAAVVLTSDEVVPPETQAYLGTRTDPTLIAIGGPATRAMPSAEAIFGDTRYTTSAAVAERFFDAPMIVGLATGANFADALTGGVVIGRGDVGPGPMLLTEPGQLPAPIEAYLQSTASTVQAVAIFGGETAVSTAVEDAVAAILAS